MIFLLGLVVVHITILAKMVFLPYPELFLYPYLANQGLIPYKQILDQHFPGLMFLPINLNNLGFQTPSDARYWQLGIVMLVQILIYVVAKRIFKSEKKALFANLIFLPWQIFFEGWVLWIDSFLPIFYLTALYFFVICFEEKKEKFAIYAGIMLGIATVFKQVTIPLVIALFVYFSFIKSKKILKFLILGYLPLPLLMVTYFFVRGAFRDFWFWTVVFNMTTFAKYGRKFANSAELMRAGFVFGFPIFGYIFRKKSNNLNLLLIFFVGSLFSSYARFDYVHLQPALPFAAIATVLALFRIRTKFRLPLTLVYFATGFYIFRGFFAGHLGSNVYFYDADTKKIVEMVKAKTSPGEHIFIFGANPNIYQMTRTIPSGDIFVFQFPWFMMEAESKVLNGLKTDKPKLVVEDRSVEIQGRVITDYAKKIDNYILENYEEVEKVGNTNILLKK